LPVDAAARANGQVLLRAGKDDYPVSLAKLVMANVGGNQLESVGLLLFEQGADVHGLFAHCAPATQLHTASL